MPVTIKSLIETIVIEYLIVLLFMRARPLYLLGISVLINCLTQPIAFFVYNFMLESSLQFPSLAYFIAVEFCVVIAEVFLIKLLLKLSLQKSVIISVSANLVTAMLSFIV